MGGADFCTETGEVVGGAEAIGIFAYRRERITYTVWFWCVGKAPYVCPGADHLLFSIILKICSAQ